jgi:hypothetical protein
LSAARRERTCFLSESSHAAADYKLDHAVKAKLDEASIEYRRGDAGK